MRLIAWLKGMFTLSVEEENDICHLHSHAAIKPLCFYVENYFVRNWYEYNISMKHSDITPPKVFQFYQND